MKQGRPVGLVVGAALLLAANASAQQTALRIETSADGVHWTTGTRLVTPGANVQCRYVATYVPAGSAAVPVGFAAVTFQPTVSNWTAADELLPFPTFGNNNNGGGVPDGTGAFGRIIPFAATGPASTDAYFRHIQNNGGVNYLRLARSSITNWIGEGPTTGTSAANNYNGAGGLVFVQKSVAARTTNDPEFQSAISNVNLARFGVRLGGATSSRTLEFDVPVAGISRGTASGIQELRWYSSATDQAGSIRTAPVIIRSQLVIGSCFASITEQPTSRSVCLGGTTRMSFGVTATPGVTYLWKFGTDVIPGATAPTLEISNATPSQIGWYSCTATLPCGSVISDSAYVDVQIPALITQPPAAQTVCELEATSLSVGVSGTGPFLYRWQRNGADVPNSNSPLLQFPSASLADAGTYQCIVTGPCNQVTSQSAELVVRRRTSWVQQPASLSRCEGQSLTLTAEATGFNTISYQWLRNGVALAGRNTPVLEFSSLSPADGGTYTCQAGALCGTIVTDPAVLTVQSRLAIVAQPPSRNVCQGTNTAISVSVSGTGPFTYKWFQNGVQLPAGSSGTLTFSPVTAANAGTYACVITGPCNTVTSSNAVVTVATPLAFTQQPVAIDRCARETASLSVAAAGDGPRTYEWRRNGTVIAGASSATLEFNSLASSNTGTYTCTVTNACGSISSTPVGVSVRPLTTISLHPVSATACVGSPAVLSVGANGDGLLTYAWKRDGNVIANATGPTISIATLTPGDAGSYTCTVTGGCGSVTTSAATLTVQSVPTWMVEPSGVDGCTNQAATLVASAVAVGPVTYQWKKNGADRPGATAPTLSFTALSPGDAGAYTCTATSPCGSITSSPAVLTVRPATAWSLHPVGLDVCEGSPIVLTAAASGAEPITYQWNRNGAPIPGANLASFSVEAASLAEAGAYTCTATGACGSAGSNAAVVNVRSLPRIATHPTASSLFAGQDATLAIASTGSGPIAYQWRKAGLNLTDSVRIAGARTANLRIISTQSIDQDRYDCVITNSCGEAVSNEATLTVLNRPDLAVTSVLAPASGLFGQPFDIEFTVRNQGSGNAIVAWSDALFLSTDPILDANDLSLRTVPGPQSVAPGGAYTRQASVLIAANAGYPEGTYYILCTTDSADRQPELDESNNTVSTQAVQLSYRRYPDLRVGAVVVPPFAEIGRTVAVRATITNQGAGLARGRWTDRAYLSANQTFEPDQDVAFTSGAEHTTEVAATGGSYEAVMTAVVPDRPGSYYIIVRTDDTNALEESNGEGNNLSIASGPIELRPALAADLVVTSIEVPGEARRGAGGQPVRWTVRNNGTAAVQLPWTDSVVLAVPGQAPVVAAQKAATVGQLAVGDEYTGTAVVSLPASFISPIVVTVRTDATNRIEELAGEANNERTADTAVRVLLPNLSANLTSVPSQIIAGSAFDVRWVTRNAGADSASGAWNEELAWSADGQWDASDVVLLTRRRTQAIASGGQSAESSASVAVPLGAALHGGTGFLLVRIDGAAVIAESDETDNVTVSSAVSASNPPLPDLIITNVTNPVSGPVGRPFGVQWTEQNVGAAVAPGSWTSKVYASLDDQLDASDLVLASVQVPGAVPPGESRVRNAVVTTPNMTGPFRLIVVADSSQSLYESQEQNNDAASANAATIQKPDLTAAELSAAQSALAGSSLPISWRVTNVGDAIAQGNWTDRVLLSLDAVSSPDDVVLAELPGQAGTAAGGEYARSFPSTIPERIEGRYFLILWVDSSGSIAERDEASNNTRVFGPITITQPVRPNLVVESAEPIPSGRVGQVVPVSFTVRNIGTAPATGQWADRVYLSNDATLDSGDLAGGVFARSGSAADIPPGGTYVATIAMTLPQTPGTYSAFFVTDVSDRVIEGVGAAELDNTRAVPNSVVVRAVNVSAVASRTDAPAATPITITGAAFDGIQPLANFQVRITIRHEGTLRSLVAQTNAAGAYQTTFTPLRWESGTYQVAAAAMGDSTPETDAVFRLYGMRPDNSTIELDSVVGETISGSLLIRNTGDTPVLNLAITMQGEAASVFRPVLNAGSIPAGGSVRLDYEASSIVAGDVPIEGQLTLGSSNARPITIPVSFLARYPEPYLEGPSDRLRASMPLGERTLIEAMIRNTGGADAMDVQVILPDASWLRLASSPIIPTIAAGESSTVLLELAPSSELPLGPYNGSLVVQTGNGSVGTEVSFTFVATTSGFGDVTIRAEDEFTFYAVGEPGLAGATVTLIPVDVSNPGSQPIVGVTGPDGAVHFAAAPAGRYTLSAEAPNHQPRDKPFDVRAGTVNDGSIFMSFEAVQYNFVLEETTVPDRYVVELETTFVTNVPLPVLVVEPMNAVVVMPADRDEVTVEYTLSNYGLIAAKDVKFRFPSAPGYQVIPLIESVGDIPAMQSVQVPVLVRRNPGRGEFLHACRELIRSYGSVEHEYECSDGSVFVLTEVTLSITDLIDCVGEIGDVADALACLAAGAGCIGSGGTAAPACLDALICLCDYTADAWECPPGDVECERRREIFGCVCTGLGLLGGIVGAPDASPGDIVETGSTLLEFAECSGLLGVIEGNGPEDDPPRGGRSCRNCRYVPRVPGLRLPEIPGDGVTCRRVRRGLRDDDDSRFARGMSVMTTRHSLTGAPVRKATPIRLSPKAEAPAAPEGGG